MLSKHIMAKGVKSITTKILGEVVLIKPIMDDLGISKVINKYAPMRETDLRDRRSDWDSHPQSAYFSPATLPYRELGKGLWG